VPKSLSSKKNKGLNFEKLNILQLNVRGLRTSTKYTIFKDFITQLQTTPDIIFLNEHWLSKHELKSFFVEGFFLAAAYGRCKKLQGGSLILIRDFLKPYVKSIKTRSEELKFEICGAKLEHNNRTLTLFSLYRPSNPTANNDFDGFFDNLENFLEQHRGVNDIILAGDLNLDLLKNDNNSRLLTDIFKTYNMSLLNQNRVTRPNCNTNGGTLIDHIFTNIQNEAQFEIINYNCSDHNAITCSLDLPVDRPKDSSRLVRDFSDKNWQTFKDLLIKENWQLVYEQSDLNEKSEVFMDTLIKYFNFAFPLKKIVVRANQINKAKLSAETWQLKNRLLLIDNELKSSLCDIEKQRLRKERSQLRKQTSILVNKEVTIRNDAKINNSSNKSATAWKILKESTGLVKSQNEIGCLKLNGNVETIKLNIANTLNQTFLVPPPNEPNPPDEYNFDQPQCKVPFILSPTNEAEVYSVICKLSPKKSSGWDEISVQTLKKISLFVVQPLCHLINCSFKSGKFPKNMKIAKIIPIFKKGDKEDASNYRPISITSSFSKVFEKIFLNRLQFHFEQNEIISSQQHGFQKGKSTVTALFNLTHEVYRSMGAREKINVILYDFSNAFGTLYPQLLLRKLKLYGVTDDAISWLLCFLTQREQYVQIRDVDCDGSEITINSERLTSDMGVPQGTILGPTSFVSYSNDITLKIIVAILILFADDSTALVKGKTINEANANTVKANTDFVEFAEENQLTINASKTKVMQMHTHQTRVVVPPELIIGDTQVEAVNNCKLLGVMLSDTMNWQIQCDKVANKLRSVTYLFTILRETVSESSLKLIYYAYAQSQILYSIVIWGGSPHMQKVFVAQKRVMRAMAGLRYWRSNCALESCKPLFVKYGILTVYSLYVLECMKFLVKNPEKFRKKSDVSQCNSPKTRSAKSKACENDLHIAIDEHKDFLIQNPEVMIARIFNTLPVPIKMLEDKKEFICKVKEIVYKYQFYDMDEFYICKFDL